jgi:flagellar protein FlaG
MDIRFDSVAPRQTVTPVSPATDAIHKQAGEPDDPARDAPTPASAAQPVTQLQDRVQTLHRELRFRVDETTGLTVVRVVEAETGDLIRQIPSRNVLELHAALESASGLLVRERA